MHRAFLLGILLAAALTIVACEGGSARGPLEDSSSLARIRADVETGFANGGWNLDRYPGLEPLKAGATITVADLTGPGVIRHIHTTRHHPADVFARGIVLEIWFDGAATPAVMSPLADFFGDGCNGRSEDFSSALVECAPWSYNAYIDMPFAKSARVRLRNDTDRDALNYSYVEWETLPRWDPGLGYFHATYRRKAFRLLPETDEVFFETSGSGHIVGRQFSVITDDPAFRGFTYVMEGNNEIAIDGRERALDYLGSEDSFTFSWGFRKTFAGRSAGMPLVEPGGDGASSSLSIFRFHDRMPIRFRRSIRWGINWSGEKHMFTQREFMEGEYKTSRESGRCWVDYATVFYWYQDSPGGYAHAPLESVAERQAPMLTSNAGIPRTPGGAPATR